MLKQPEFGQKLRAMRVASGLSQAELAGQGMSAGYLSRLESGARPPTERAVTYLADRLGVQRSAFDETRIGSMAQALAAVTSGEEDGSVAQLAGVLSSDESADSALRWQALWRLADYKRRQAQYEEENAYLTELVALSDELAIPELMVRAHVRLSRSRRSQGDIEQARVFAAKALVLAREGDLPAEEVAGALLTLVSAEAESGHLLDARAHSDELNELVGELTGTMPVQALWTAATVRVRQGDWESAQAFLERALDRLDSHDDLMLWLRLRLAAASLYLQLRPTLTEKAAILLDQAEPAIHLIGSQQQQNELLAIRAHLAFREGRVTEARALYDRLRDADARLSFRDEMRLEVLNCQLLVHEGRRDEGLARLQELANQAQESVNVDLAAEMWRIMAETLADTFTDVPIQTPESQPGPR
jgi:transcriptional regulator with XRE-family HTH domain